MSNQDSQNTTNGIYSLDCLKQALNNNRRFNFVLFSDLNAKNPNLNQVKQNCLSKLYPVRFIDDNKKEYSSSLQYTVSQKASMTNDKDIFEEIMSNSDPEQILNLEKQIKNFNPTKWNNISDEIVYQGNYYKFNQNEQLKTYILSFPLNTIFVYANPEDEIWGIQMNPDDPQSSNPNEWQGMNKLGFQLTRVRDDLHDSKPNQSNSDHPIFQSYSIHEIPGIYAGEYPASLSDNQTKIKVKQLLDFGIKHFVDLTEEGELNPYEQLLPQDVTHLRFPIVDGNSPISLSDVNGLLEEIEEMRKDGGYIYIHCWGGVGRTSTIVSCLLAKTLNIMNYKEVLKILLKNYFRMPKSEYKGLPLKKGQKHFVKQFISSLNEKSHVPKSDTKHKTKFSSVKKYNKEIFKETLDIVELGLYTADDGTKYDISKQINKSVSNTVTIPESYSFKKDLLQQIKATKNFGDEETSAIYEKIEICDESTFAAAQRLKNIYKKVCVLNFANGFEPCGAVFKGSSSQEETLARQSNLYSCLENQNEMYDYNISQGTPFCSHYMIYSPKVVVFRDDDYKLVAPFCVNVISSPAVNCSHFSENKNKNVCRTMKNRCRRIVQLAIQRNNEVLVLGAFGCGSFQNKAEDVSRIFREIIVDEFYGMFFTKIVFAIKGEKSLNIFKTEFEQ